MNKDGNYPVFIIGNMIDIRDDSVGIFIIVLSL